MILVDCLVENPSHRKFSEKYGILPQHVSISASATRRSPGFKIVSHHAARHVCQSCYVQLPHNQGDTKKDDYSLVLSSKLAPGEIKCCSQLPELTT